MADDQLRTLFHPFQTGRLAPPDDKDGVLFLGARPGFVLPQGWRARIVPVQGFRPDFDALERQGLEPVARAPDETFGLTLILCGRHRGRNENFFAEAVRRTRPGGRIVIAGDRKAGAGSLAKRIGAAFEVEERLSKFHGVVFWLSRPVALSPGQEALIAEPPQQLIDGRYVAAPGMFSSARVDPGSALLARHLPPDLDGHVADFAAGWGYLSVELLARCPGMSALDLFEADHESLEAARRNVEAAAPSVPVGFHWCDLTRAPARRRFDAVVMNPPFHEGRAADPALGQALIAAAAKSLKSGGRLYLVANRQLPYEKALERGFSQQGRLADEGGYKVLWAQAR